MAVKTLLKSTQTITEKKNQKMIKLHFGRPNNFKRQFSKVKTQS
jgi:hypothetical protein